MKSPNSNPPPASQPRSSPSASPSSSPSLAQTLTSLSTPLTPLVHILTGIPHPEFPSCILSFHLLTSPQLDRLAVYYHQVWPPTPQTGLYPVVMRAWVGWVYGDGEGEADIGIEEKRKRFGWFIGLYEAKGICLGVGLEEKEEEEDAMDLDGDEEKDDEDDLIVEISQRVVFEEILIWIPSSGFESAICSAERLERKVLAKRRWRERDGRER